MKLPTYDEIIQGLPARRLKKGSRAKKQKQRFALGASVCSRFRTMNRQGQNVSSGAHGVIMGFNASSGKYLVQWSNGDGYYDGEVLE